MVFTFYCGQIYGIEKFFYIEINSNLVTKFPIFLEMEKNLLDINSSHWIRDKLGKQMSKQIKNL